MSILPSDRKSSAVRCGYRNAFPELADARQWWPSRAMTKADYQRIERHLRHFERAGDDTICLSLVSAALLGLDSDEPALNADERSAFFEVEDVRSRLSGFVGLAILDVLGAE